MIRPNGNGSEGHSQRRPVVLSNPHGLHMRPAAAFAELARKFTSQVLVWRSGRSVNGKSWLDLIMLAAEPGTELEIEVMGDDADRAIEPLAALLGSPGAVIEPK